MKKVKLAIYNGQLYVGGIEKVLINYLTKLSKDEELDITLIIKENLPEKNFFKQDIPENIKLEFIKSEEYCKKVYSVSHNKKNLYKRLKKQWYLFYNKVIMQRWVDNYFSENKFDMIIDFDGSLVDYLKNVEIPVIGWIHFSLSKMNKKKYEEKRRKFEKYSKIVAICDDMVKEYKNYYPQLEEKIVRIYNPVNYDEIEIKSNEYDELTETELYLLKQEYFVAVSRLVPAKNRVAMVEIYNKLKKKGRREKLYIIGDGNDRINIEKRIKELDLENDVLLLGERKNPFPFVKNAKLFLNTSLGEGLPTVLIEALLCKIIVVSYDCPTGPREILMNGNAGGLIELNNQDKFVDKVIEIMENKELQTEINKEMGKIVEEFKYDEIRKQLFAVFKTIKNVEKE